MSSNTRRFAERELSILSKSATDPEDRPLIEPFTKEILALVDAFGNSGQSGGSAPYTAAALSQAIKKLCLQESICHIMGIEEEWIDVSIYGDGTNGNDNIVYQNSRCGGLFKNKAGQSWYLDAIVWKADTKGESGNDWDTFTGRAISHQIIMEDEVGNRSVEKTTEIFTSRQYVKSFPFTPKTFYIDVTREQLPEDWNKEPFIEGKEWYDTEEYEKTGVKNWHKDKYRYIIKDRSQLERVFKYYDQYSS